MGNTTSVKTDNFFYTSCMAKYTCITKPQVMAIRNLLVLLSHQQKEDQLSTDSTTMTTPTMMVSRKSLHKAMEKVNIASEPDYDVIDLIFTMWLCQFNCNQEETTSHGILPQLNNTIGTKKHVPWYELLISLSLLACKTDTLEQTIRFTLYVVHRNHFSKQNTNATALGHISSTDAVSFLHAFCTTAMFYGDGDVALPSNQIQQLVDSIFTISDTSKVDDTTKDDESFHAAVVQSNNSMVVQQKDELSFDEFVKGLLQQQAVKAIVVLPIPPKRRMVSMKKKKKARNSKNSNKTSVDIVENDKKIDIEAPPTTSNVRKTGIKISNMIQNVAPCGGGRDGTNSDDDIVVRVDKGNEVTETSATGNVIRKMISPRNAHGNNNNFHNINTNGHGNHNTSKYMPLIDEIERDAKKKIGTKYIHQKHKMTPILSDDDEPGSPMALGLSSSCSITDDQNDDYEYDDDDIQNIDKNEIQLTTTEEIDDDRDEVTGIEVGCNDDKINNDGVFNSLKVLDEQNKKKEVKTKRKNKMNVRIISTLKNIKQQHQPREEQNHSPKQKVMKSTATSFSYYTTSQYSNNDISTNSPSSVPSTDLSSHMSSVKLIPVTRIGISKM